jgi:hypothetical protein
MPMHIQHPTNNQISGGDICFSWGTIPVAIGGSVLVSAMKNPSVKSGLGVYCCCCFD